ncbi:putative Heat shock protein Hsp90 family [Lupinus albus]|uniref:Putative Heat shock protein Hsp90 family n=1 Tax=Lupinus albus TaxID=3870 RepID=A0A6A4QML4_LUPAL|nr:putative Heat shock protein Hsp90 family [Lupinus albus]
MKPDQKDIYYIASDSVTSAKNTPFLERLAEKDLEVLFLVDPIDEVAVQNLKSYKEKNFVDISKEDLEIGLFLPDCPFFMLLSDYLFWIMLLLTNAHLGY